MTDVQEETRSMSQARRGLGFLLASTGVAITGQGMVIAAAPLMAASLTRDPLAVSAVTAASYAAWLLVGLPAGALVDRWPRRTVLVTTDLLRAVVLGLLTLLILTDHASVPILLVAVFLVGVGNCFFDPASQAALPLVVGRDKDALSRANGKIWALDMFGRSLAGPPLGAAAFGVAAALPFGLDSAAFLASALLLLGLGHLDNGAAAEHPPLARSVWEGLKYLFGHRTLRLLAFGMGAYNLSYNVAFATLVLFAQDELSVSNTGFGLLIAVLAVGGIFGGWLAPHVGRRLSALATYAAALIVQGAAWAIVGLSHHAWLAGVGLALVGLASTTVSVIGGSARQLLTPDDKLGRVVSVTRIFGIGGAALGAVIGGTLASLWGIYAPFVGCVALLAAFGAYFSFAATRTHSDSLTT